MAFLTCKNSRVPSPPSAGISLSFPAEIASLFECFPCVLSRACLGKMMILFGISFFSIKWRTQKACFCSYRYRGSSHPQAGTSMGNASFFDFSLCLSRACLGKMIVFIYKWCKNGVFLTSHTLNTLRRENTCQKSVQKPCHSMFLNAGASLSG